MIEIILDIILLALVTAIVVIVTVGGMGVLPCT